MKIAYMTTKIKKYLLPVAALQCMYISPIATSIANKIPKLPSVKLHSLAYNNVVKGKS